LIVNSLFQATLIHQGKQIAIDMQLPGYNFLYISKDGIDFKDKLDITHDILSISNRKSSMQESSRQS
jgi:hypothetical protein